MTQTFHCSKCGREFRLETSIEGLCPRCLFKLGLEPEFECHEKPGLRSGDIVGHFGVLKMLGRGGMAEVYLAWDNRLNRRVALKVLPKEVADDPERKERLKSEALAAAALKHPNICTVYDFLEADDRTCIVMEYVEGERLDHHHWHWQETILVANQLLEALEEAHQRGIIHRDLKPSNILVESTGSLKIMDFGLAKTVAHGKADLGELPTSLTQAGCILGTPAYMAPEQIRGKSADARSDLFSVGVILYQMLTDTHPFKGDSLAEVASSVLRDDPVPVGRLRPGIPGTLQKVVSRSLEKDPEKRYQSAAEFRKEIQGLSGIRRFLGTFPGRRYARLGLVVGILAISVAIWQLVPDNSGTDRSPGSLDPETTTISTDEVLMERARRLTEKFSADDNRQAIRLLEEAIRRNPESAEAHGLMSLAQLKRFWWYQQDQILAEAASDSASRALKLKPDLAVARVVQDIFRTLTSPAPEAYVDLARCMKADPFQAEAAGWLAYNFLAKSGDFSSAELILEQLRAAHPDSPYPAIVESFLHVQKGEFADAAREIKTIQLLLPDSDAGAFLEALAGIQSENRAMLERALRTYELISLDKPTADVFRRYLAACSNSQKLAEGVSVAALRADYEAAALYAQTLARLGENRDALHWLNQSIQRGNYNLIQLRHPDFDSLRFNPEFLSLTRTLEARSKELSEQLRTELGIP